MVAFSTVKTGDVLYDCRRTKMGNTTMSQMSTWKVQVLSVDAEQRCAMVSWNGNSATRYTERHLKRLRRSPVQVRK